MSVAFFLLSFISPFVPTILAKIVLGIDIIFSYLYAADEILPLIHYTNLFQMVDRVHLCRPRLQLAQLSRQCSPRNRLREKEGQRILHVPHIVRIYIISNMYDNMANMSSLYSFFTILGIFLEITSLWADRDSIPASHPEKHVANGNGNSNSNGNGNGANNDDSPA